MGVTDHQWTSLVVSQVKVLLSIEILTLIGHVGKSENLRYCAKKMIISPSSRMLFSAALLCTFFLPAALPAPAAFPPSLSQLQQLPLQFQKSLRALLGQKTAIVTYKGRPTTLAPRRRNLQVNNNTNKTFNHCLTTTQRQ